MRGFHRVKGCMIPSYADGTGIVGVESKGSIGVSPVRMA
jgi:hypothetical protein